MDVIFFAEKKLSKLSPVELNQLVREGELTREQAKKILREKNAAKKIWQPIHDQIKQKRFP